MNLKPRSRRYKCADLFKGFSYADKEVGSLNVLTKEFMNASEADVTGRFPVIDATEIGECRQNSLTTMNQG